MQWCILFLSDTGYQCVTRCFPVECRLDAVNLNGGCTENLTPIPADTRIEQVRYDDADSR